MPAHSRLHFKSNVNSFENQFLPRKLLQRPESCSPTFRASGAGLLLNNSVGKLFLPRLDALPAAWLPTAGLGAGWEAWSCSDACVAKAGEGEGIIPESHHPHGPMVHGETC